MSWSDNRRISTDIGWYMPYFTTAEYGWQVREPIHDMLIRIVDNTYDPEYMPDYRSEIHFIADQMMAPDRKIDGKDCRYVSTMKKLLVKSFHTLDLSRAQWEYVAPGEEPYPFDEPCDDEIISIWYAEDPTIVREQGYKAFMKLAYGDWINYDKKCTLVESPKTVVCTSFTRVTVHGTTNGLGTMITGINRLRPRLEAIPNGTMGTLVSYSGWQSPDGYTFNSGDATKLFFLFKRDGDIALTPSDIGDIMLVEGSTIPTTYDASTTLFDAEITQGTTTRHDANSSSATSQGLLCGYDEYGRYNLYGQTAEWLTKRCKTFSIDIEPNTDYSVRMFNNAYEDFRIEVQLFKAPGTVTPEFTSCSAYTQKSIPGNTTFVMANEQWMVLRCSQTRSVSDHWGPVGSVPCDVRPIRYEFCNYYATLKAGTYKIMIDAWGNNRIGYYSGGEWTGVQNYSGCVEDNFNVTGNPGNEWFALIEEDNTVIISKSDILPPITGDKIVNTSTVTPPYPNYFHKEVEFTLDHNAKVGLIHKAYYTSVTYDYPAYFRFMIVDPDVEAQYFKTTGAVPVQMEGYSAWEKYQIVVSINVKFTDVIANTSTTLTKTVPSLLYSGDFVDFTEDLPTYYSSDDYGIVTVEVLDKDQEDPTIMPTIDINYH